MQRSPATASNTQASAALRERSDHLIASPNPTTHPAKVRLPLTAIHHPPCHCHAARTSSLRTQRTQRTGPCTRPPARVRTVASVLGRRALSRCPSVMRQRRSSGRVPEVPAAADDAADSVPLARTGERVQLGSVGRAGGSRGSSARLRGKGVRRPSQLQLRTISSDASASADEGVASAKDGRTSDDEMSIGSRDHGGSGVGDASASPTVGAPKHRVRGPLEAAPDIAAIHSAPVIIDHAVQQALHFRLPLCVYISCLAFSTRCSLPQCCPGTYDTPMLR